MRDYSTLSPTFWTGVINYIRTSAPGAEVPSTAKKDILPAMQGVFVFKTSIAGPVEMKMISSALTKLTGKGKWTIDLDDEDKVLRVVCAEQVEKQIISILNQFGFSCELMPY